MIDKQQLNQWVDQLPEDDQKTIYEFVQFLVHKNNVNDVETFYNTLPEVDEPWSEEEKRQFAENSGWMELDVI